MKNFKINLVYNIHKGPWGGGNQFLKALRKEFIKKGIYENNVNNADCILFNSHHNIEEVIKLKLKNRDRTFIHRVDGPIFKIRNMDYELDKKIYSINNLIADGTIFQSYWSKKENFNLGMKKSKYETIIINAPDSIIFNRKNRTIFDKKRKIKLIATSWADDYVKGFRIYQYLDNELDFTKYEMTFIGNSPIEYKNIRWIKPLKSIDLARQLKQHDIFIAASLKDPCSNSLIEALHCGLPAIVRDDGGHPEIIRNGGETFKSKNDIIKKIEKVSQNYHYYQKNIKFINIEQIADTYYNFIKKIYRDYENEVYNPKNLNILKKCKIFYILFAFRIKSANIYTILRKVLRNIIRRNTKILFDLKKIIIEFVNLL